MKKRLAKLAFAGAILLTVGLRATPAESACLILSHIASSEEECASTCYGGGCYGYHFDGAGCYCY